MNQSILSVITLLWGNNQSYFKTCSSINKLTKKNCARKWTRFTTERFYVCAGIKVTTRIIKLCHQMVLGQQRRPHSVWQIEFLIVHQASLSYPKVFCLELRWQTAFLVSDSYNIFKYVVSVVHLGSVWNFRCIQLMWSELGPLTNIHLDCLLGFKERYERWRKYEGVCS